MKYTNKLNLPEVFVKIYKSKEDKEFLDNRYSVTELLKSTREIKLKRKYFKELEEDISECIPTLFGSAVHKIFEENNPEDESEIKMELELSTGDILVGVIDHVKDDIIEDYKTSSTSKVSKKDFKDYEQQVIAYAWMRFKKYGIITRKGNIYILMKDWSKIKAQKASNYPSSPIYIHSFDIKDSDYDYIEKYIYNKIKEIKSDELPLCSDEERWYTGTDYAIYKKLSDKRASYVTNNEQEAHNYIRNKCNGAAEIKVRKGEYLKCKLYCICNKYCEQYRKEEKNDII